MKNFKAHFIFAIFLGIALLGASPASFAQTANLNLANTPSGECDMSSGTGSGLSSCASSAGNPVGTHTSAYVLQSDGTCSGAASTPNSGLTNYAYCGGSSDAQSNAFIPIQDSHGNNCFYVDNTTGNSIFVPFKSDTEYANFRSNHPSGITLTPCALPNSIKPVTKSVGPPYSGCTQLSINTPNVYGRGDGTGHSVWPATVKFYPANSPAASQTFLCHGGSTKIPANQQWTAIPGDWQQSFQFGPDATITAQDTTTSGTAATTIYATIGDTIVLNFSTTPISPATITGTVASASSLNGNPAAWSITSSSISGTTTSGSGSVTLTANDTYYFTVMSTDSNGLSSTATATVIAQAAATCGSASTGNNDFTSAPSSNLCNNSSLSGSVGGSASSGGWYWTCKTTDGNTAQCPATVEAQCGSGTVTVTAVDGSGNPTSYSGQPCTLGNPIWAGNTTSGFTYACQNSFTYNSATSTSTTATCNGTAAYIPPSCAAQPVSWKDASGTYSCSGTAAQTSVGQSTTITTANGATDSGQASFTCNSGGSGNSFSLTANTTPTCAQGCNVTYGIIRNGISTSCDTYDASGVAQNTGCPYSTCGAIGGYTGIGSDANQPYLGIPIPPTFASYSNGFAFAGFTAGQGLCVVENIGAQSLSYASSATCPSPPTVSLTASQTTITSGGNSLLTWNVSGAASCTASSSPDDTNFDSYNPSSTALLSGGALGVTVSPTTTTTYTLKCSNTSGSNSSSVAITVGSSCSGYSYNGYCYYGALGPQTCDALCSTHGGSNLAGTIAVGSGGTDADCGAVLEGTVGHSGSNLYTIIGPTIDQTGSPVGCTIYPYHLSIDAWSPNRYTSPTTTTTGLGGPAHACACNQ